VFAGMLGVTLFGLVLTPVFYVVVQGLAARLSRRKRAAVPQETALSEGH
jgi:gold/copper resistance efflux pump